MTADTTMTDVDTRKAIKDAVDRATRISRRDLRIATEKLQRLEREDNFCRLLLGGGPELEMAREYKALSSRYDELKKLQNVTSELWQSAERERDELERLAGAAERYHASARSYFEKYAAGRMNSHELQPFREQFLDADKSLAEALEAYQRKGE